MAESQRGTGGAAAGSMSGITCAGGVPDEVVSSELSSKTSAPPSAQAVPGRQLGRPSGYPRRVGRPDPP